MAMLRSPHMTPPVASSKSFCASSRAMIAILARAFSALQADLTPVLICGVSVAAVPWRLLLSVLIRKEGSIGIWLIATRPISTLVRRPILSNKKMLRAITKNQDTTHLVQDRVTAAFQATPIFQATAKVSRRLFFQRSISSKKNSCRRNVLVFAA